MEPQIVKLYREKVKEKLYPPKCCYTCDHYADHDWCNTFAEKVPKDFAESLDQCESWTEEVPF